MIQGAHIILYSKEPQADLAFLRDVLGEPPSVDAGGGWLIVAMPPAEFAVHPSDENDVHEVYFTCPDVHEFRREMASRNVETSEVSEQRWGSLVHVSLPGGGKLGVYQPKHPSPVASPPKRSAAKAPRAAKKGATKKVPPKKVAAKTRGAKRKPK